MTTEEEIKQLQTELENLKKEIKENREADEKRSKEIQELQTQRHEDNLKWQKISTLLGACSTPLTLVIGFFTWYLKNKESNPAPVEPKIKSKEIKKIKGDIRLIKTLMTLSEEARRKRIKEESEDEWGNGDE